MKKIIILISIAILSIFISSTNVSAKQCTGQNHMPYLYQISPSNRTSTYNLYTSAATCKGSNTEVWYNNFKSLPSSYPYQDGMIYVYLMEEDANNADDMVKGYGGAFYNKVISSFVLSNTYISGNIEATGDQRCELYLKGFVSGDCCNNAINSTLFDYKICMN